MLADDAVPLLFLVSTCLPFIGGGGVWEVSVSDCVEKKSRLRRPLLVLTYQPLGGV